MLEYLVFGSGLAFAAAVQPGPLQAFLLARVAATGWRRTLPACLSPLLSDGPIALVSLLVLGQLPDAFQHGLRGAGGLLLIYLAWSTLRRWRAPTANDPGGSAPRTLLAATFVNLLNPNPWLGWAFVLGPSVRVAWNEQRAYAVGLLVAFYGTMVLTTAAFVLLVGTTRFLSDRSQRVLVAASVCILAGLGAFLLIGSLAHLASGVR